MPKQDFGHLHDETDGLGWQKGCCPGLSSLRCTAGSCSAAANLSPAPCSPAWRVPRHPPSIPSPCEPRGAASPSGGSREGKAALRLWCCPASHQTPIPDPPWEGTLPKAAGLWCGPRPCPPPPAGRARTLPWQARNVPNTLAKQTLPRQPRSLPSRPLSPPGCRIFRPHCKLSSAGKCEAMENQAGPRQPGHLPPPQPLHLADHRLPSSRHLRCPIPAGLPAPPVPQLTTPRQDPEPPELQRAGFGAR